MNMAVNAARSYDQVLASNNFCRGSDYQLGIDTFHRVRIPGLADLDDTPVFDAYIPLHNSPVVQDDRVGDYHVECAVMALPNGSTALAHAVAYYFSSAESNFIAVVRKVFFDFYN